MKTTFKNGKLWLVLKFRFYENNKLNFRDVKKEQSIFKALNFKS
jgi:hypothetical protein